MKLKQRLQNVERAARDSGSRRIVEIDIGDGLTLTIAEAAIPALLKIYGVTKETGRL